jgi:DNA-directed RNA polymerase subunit RPC12/RpoP/preprotein translocase subunit SecG
MKDGRSPKAVWGKIGGRVRAFFAGRYGMDALSRTMLWVGLVFYILDLFLASGFFLLLSMAFYIVVVFRALSRNKDRRAYFNGKYQTRISHMRTAYSQARVRFANRKVYKYVRCPQCRTLIRLPRGKGLLSARCKSCSHAFDQRT